MNFSRLFEGFLKLGMGAVVTYLFLKHFVGATRLMKEGSISLARIFVSLAEPAAAAKRIL